MTVFLIVLVLQENVQDLNIQMSEEVLPNEVREVIMTGTGQDSMRKIFRLMKMVTASLRTL